MNPDTLLKALEESTKVNTMLMHVILDLPLNESKRQLYYEALDKMEEVRKLITTKPKTA